MNYVDPNDLIIVGLDTDDREGHPLFDPRVFEELNDNFVKNVMVYGVQKPVLVRADENGEPLGEDDVDE